MLFLAAQVGASVFEAAAAVGVGLLLGQYLGTHFGSSDLGLLIGGFLGLLAAVMALWRLGKKLGQSNL